MAAPLHALTRKNARFAWGPEQQAAFIRLKERLTTAPILGMPRDEGTYYLDTDASDVGIAAVLSQDQDGREVVLAYASRSLSKAEQNYDVTRRKLLAVVYGLKAYQQYLLGRQFVIRTGPFGTSVGEKDAGTNWSTGKMANFHRTVYIRYHAPSRITASERRRFIKTASCRK